jgi:spermidine/putrescine transport system ATP-binding protein
MAPEPLLRLDAVSKVFPGGTIALDHVDLEVRQGEFLTLLGPSGCGKTTCLRVVAGFEEPTGGRVLLDGRDITALRPYDRPVNTVFQDYALFPHMNVAENVGFGLTLRKLGGEAIRSRVAAALALVDLSDKIETKVSALSGGQKQRVALARALVCEPRVLLLDEPLSALDAHLREQMQVELKRLQARLGTTFIMVTHDQKEALSISDRVAVMNRGRIEQVAAPPVLYDAPATRFVASFFGTMNVLESRALDGKANMLRVAVGQLAFEALANGVGPFPGEGQQIAVCIRPEDILIEPAAVPGAAPARIVATVFHGSSLRVHVELADGTALTIDAPRRACEKAFTPGELLHVSVRPGAARALLSS